MLGFVLLSVLVNNVGDTTVAGTEIMEAIHFESNNLGR